MAASWHGDLPNRYIRYVGTDQYPKCSRQKEGLEDNTRQGGGKHTRFVGIYCGIQPHFVHILAHHSLVAVFISSDLSSSLINPDSRAYKCIPTLTTVELEVLS